MAKYNKGLRDAIVEALKLGVPISHICANAGISRETFYLWKKKYGDFDTRVRAAQSKHIARNLLAIEKAAQGMGGVKPDWRAAAWLLEKQYPTEFGYLAQVKLEHVDKGGEASLEDMVKAIGKAKNGKTK